jgi:hypothetical protein
LRSPQRACLCRNFTPARPDLPAASLRDFSSGAYSCAERFIRTLKENLLWVHTFETIEDLRQALLAFREAYNTTWLIERHGFMTPAAARQKQLQPAAMAA